MEHLDVPQWLATLAVMLGVAKGFGILARRIDQPAVLGELLAGVVVGPSVLGLVEPRTAILQLFAELGVIILLFEIGLETDLAALLKVGGASASVALAGVVLPFGLGYAACRLLGLDDMVAIVAGAALTATSVGITARVLADLGRLQDPESRVVLGAAVIDDIVGLVILTIVARLTEGRAVTVAGVATTAGVAFGFLLATLLLGRFLIPPLFRLVDRVDLKGTGTIAALVLAFVLAWLAERSGSALIVGAFAAGLLLAGTTQRHEIERGVVALGHFFVPLFFVAVGAAVDVRVFDPLDPGNRPTLLAGGLLIAAAVLGKFLAGFVPFWFRGRKSVIGVGMIPRGEVGLIFAQMGLASGCLDPGLFGAITLMVMVTTFLAPPLLKHLLRDRPIPKRPGELEEVGDLVTSP